MLRNKPASSMQKTYDDCFLICSTAIYFESQGNEAEALRSWKDALDQICYHNAYRVPSTYRPRTETERALQGSLRDMELQCKERVDLLEALKKSRSEKKDGKTESGGNAPTTSNVAPLLALNGAAGSASKVDQAARPQSSESPAPPLPLRPQIPPRQLSSNDRPNNESRPQSHQSVDPPKPPSLAAPSKKPSRTPSPDKKKPGMLKTLRPNKEPRKGSSSSVSSFKPRPPAAAKAATQAWGGPGGTPSLLGPASPGVPRESSQSGYFSQSYSRNLSSERLAGTPVQSKLNDEASTRVDASPKPSYPTTSSRLQESQGWKESREQTRSSSERDRPKHVKPPTSTPRIEPAELPSYRREYLPPDPRQERIMNAAMKKPTPPDPSSARSEVPRRTPVRATGKSTPRRRVNPSTVIPASNNDNQRSTDHQSSSGSDREPRANLRARTYAPLSARERDATKHPEDSPLTSEEPADEEADEDKAWKERAEKILKNLPKGVDESAAKQILNEIVIQGDEVHWSDVAGLEIAKSALKETVVYPFLRPDLFMGLREPARGMLLFGPPGTGKTMLARAVATESKSTFFAISASSLTSKYLGESEKLVRALFSLAKSLAPSIIFVDEIDSLLSARAGSGEHEATRRIKTEFLIQWSDLAKAAAGKEQTDRDKERGDASRVLVLAATNLPWAIDEAARRRFVRRQYIPLPEDHVRRTQLQNLLSHQKHSLVEGDLDSLVELTDGFSGSDITALAKDAAMGPLRSLGEKLLSMTMDEIRPIGLVDFESSLVTIRPSVSKLGLKEYDDWAKEFGERGG